jgi:hypothetical protein
MRYEHRSTSRVSNTFPSLSARERIAGGQPIKADEAGIGSIDRQRGRIDPRVLTNYPGSRAVFIE